MALLDQESMQRLLSAVAAVKNYTGYGNVNLKFYRMKIIEAELTLTDKSDSKLRDQANCANIDHN